MSHHPSLDPNSLIITFLKVFDIKGLLLRRIIFFNVMHRLEQVLKGVMQKQAKVKGE